MPSTLIWRCTPIHSKSRQKIAEVGVDRQCPPRARAPSSGPPSRSGAPRPTRCTRRASSETRSYVIGPVHRVLEVEHARVGLAHHQVARVVVAMHEHARLREIVREHRARTRASSACRCVGVERAPQCRATYQSGNSSSSRRSSASSYGGSTPSREARWKRTSASIASTIQRVGASPRRARARYVRVPRSSSSRKPRSRSCAMHLAARARPRRAAVARRARTAGSSPSAAARPWRSASCVRRQRCGAQRDAEIAAEARVLGGGRERERVRARATPPSHSASASRRGSAAGSGIGVDHAGAACPVMCGTPQRGRNGASHAARMRHFSKTAASPS